MIKELEHKIVASIKTKPIESTSTSEHTGGAGSHMDYSWMALDYDASFQNLNIADCGPAPMPHGTRYPNWKTLMRIHFSGTNVLLEEITMLGYTLVDPKNDSDADMRPKIPTFKHPICHPRPSPTILNRILSSPYSNIFRFASITPPREHEML